MKTYYCPLCQHELIVQAGTQLDPSDGVTLYCPSWKCPAQEVFGHGTNEENAYQVVKEKYPLIKD